MRLDAACRDSGEGLVGGATRGAIMRVRDDATRCIERYIERCVIFD